MGKIAVSATGHMEVNIRCTDLMHSMWDPKFHNKMVAMAP